MSTRTRERRPKKLPPPLPPLSFTVELPGLPPTANHAYKQTTRVSNSGKVFAGRRLTDEAEDWRSSTAAIIQAAKNEAGWMASRWSEIALEITYAMPHPAQDGDLDNFNKVLIDAIKMATGVDDRYVMDLNLHKRKHAEASTLITITKVYYGNESPSGPR